MAREPWRESLEDGERGGWRRVLRRVFGDGENPLSWGFPLYAWRGIRVRIHVLFVVFLVAELIRALVPSGAGLVFVAPVLLALFVLVLLHEYGHCFACRRVGGEADEILLWPLGGLASCLPPHRWRAHLWTTAGGPLVNAALLLPLGLAAWGVTGEIGCAVFNPFDPYMSAALIGGSTDLGKVARVFVWALHYANLVILAFNVLVPMYPMDGGRLLRAALWARMGYRDATRAAAIVGMAAAGVLAVFAISFSETMLLAIGLLGGIVCYWELRTLKFEEGTDPGVFVVEPEIPEEPGGAEIRRMRREAEEKAEIDRILAKISATGMESLTRGEKRTLEKASAKRRG